MKVLVTGGAGFIGTNLIKRLLKDGHEVHSVDNYSTGFKENKQVGCMYHEYDISSPHLLGIYVDHNTYPAWRELDFDLVFHLAALARIQPSFRNPQEVFKVNTLGTQQILEWARGKDIPVVYAGSSSTHGDHYANPYTFTKWQGEQLCKLYNKVYQLPTVICRFYNVYGEHQLEDGVYATLIGIFEKQYREGKALTVTGNGEQRRDFTHVDDIVDGLVKAGEGLFDDVIFTAVEGFTFELGRGKNYSILEITEMFGETEVEYIPQRPGEMEFTLCESRQARSTLGWNPKIDIRNYISKIIK